MRVDTIGHEGAIGRWNRTGTSWTRGSSCWAIGSSRVAIGRSDSVRGGLGGLRRLRRVGMTAQTGTFKEMLFLSRGVLCSNLLTVDTLDGETLNMHKPQNGFWYVSDEQVVGEILRNTGVTHLVIFLGAELDKRGVYFLVDGATHDGNERINLDQTRKQRTLKEGWVRARMGV